RSEKDLLRYLDKNPLVIPDCQSSAVGLLVSDSKGNRLRAVHTETNVPLKFLCVSGGNTERLLKELKHHLPKFIKDIGKPFVVYWWTGTCDLTVKQGRFIDCNLSRSVITDTVKLYIEASAFVQQFQGCKIKFIGQPIYLVSLYNDICGHMLPTDFLDSDRILEQQVDKLNREIEHLNGNLGVTTLKFNADLRDCRHKGKNYFFELLYDGLHPDKLLSQKWLRRIQLDIIKECYQPKLDDILDIQVDPIELSEFEQREDDFARRQRRNATGKCTD
ncbi:hypothetical protein FSP39_019035, partial [Pinctada imbricata]